MRMLMLSLIFAATGCGSEHGFSHLLPNNSVPEDIEQYDIVIVLDTSGSMNDNTYIDYGFTQIPVDLNSRGADWQMVFTAASEYTHSHYEVDPSSNGWDVLNRLQETRQHTNHGADEAGIGAAIRWYKLEDQWLRPEAKPILIFVSDENDNSQRANTEIFNYWPSNTHVLSITGISNEYSDICGYVEVGQAYIDISNRVLDICTVAQWSIFEN